MSLRGRLLSLLRSAGLASAGRLAAAPSSRRSHLPPASAGAASSSGSESNDGNFSDSSNPRSGSSFGAILIGQAAVFLSLGNSVLAQDDSVTPAATTSGHADADVTSLRRIEDSSVISNEHTVNWRLLTNKAQYSFLKGRLDEAEKLFKAALHEAKEGFGPRDPRVRWALNNLAEFYRLRKEYKKAEPLYLEEVEILEQSFGPGDIRVGTALHNLGQCYHIQGRFDHAQTCYEIGSCWRRLGITELAKQYIFPRALKIEGRVMGPGHPGYANTMFLLAMVLSRERKGKDAEALARESIRILEEAGLGESPACIQRRMFLSNELVNLKQLAEAEILQRKILHTLELLKGWNSLDTAIAAENLGITLRFIGKVKESEELLERCLAVRKNILSEDHIQVASTLVHLANLTLISITNGVKVKNDLRRSHLVSGERLVNDSIRITQGILYTLREDGKKPNNAFAIERERIAATALLLEALRIVGLLDTGRISVQKHALFLKLPLERMKHGYFKIDAAGISDTCRQFIWPDKHLRGDTTLRIHFHKFEKFDYQYLEQALCKCISLYNEPHTRDIVSNALRQHYMVCLSSLISCSRQKSYIFNTPQMQDLLAESQQIMRELGEENNNIEVMDGLNQLVTWGNNHV